MRPAPLALALPLAASGCVLLLAAAGCSRPAPEKPAQGASTGASAQTDSSMTAKVKAVLATDVGRKTLGIGVDANGGVVTLSGQVDSLDTKQRAQRAAESVAGVTWVQNRLSIAPRGS